MAKYIAKRVLISICNALGACNCRFCPGALYAGRSFSGGQNDSGNPGKYGGLLWI